MIFGKLNKRAVAMFSLCLILFITIVPFAVYADSYAPVYFRWNQRNSGGFTENVNVTFRYLYNNEYKYLTCYYHVHQYTYQSGSYGSNYWYSDYFFTVNGDYQNMVLFEDGKYGKTIFIRINDVTYNISTVSHEGNYNLECVNLSSTRPISSNNGLSVVLFDNSSLGYTLTFDPQGGSSIASESGVTDIVLGADDEYYPQYIPTRPGYIFHGWSRYESGPILYSTTLTEDTTLYAQWYESDSEVAVTFPSGSYYDRNMGNAISGTIAVDNNEDFTFYYEYTGTSYFTGKLNLIDSHNRIYDVISAAEMYDPDPNDYINPYKYKYSYNFTKVTTIQPLVSSLLEVNGYIDILPYSYLYEDIAGFVQDCFVTINYPGGQSYLFPFTRDSANESIYFNRSGIPPGSTIDISAKIIPPLKPQRGYVSYPDRDEGEIVEITIYESFVDDINNQYGYYENVKLSFIVEEDIDFNLLIVPIQNTQLYHIPIIIKDESTGEYVYTFSETEFYDTEWSEVGTIFPSNLGKILDGLYGLQGLAIIVPLVMMVSFAMWFIRRS